VTVLLVGLGAAIGAPLRYLLGLRWDTDRFPWGIWSANVVGSFVLGALVGAHAGGATTALLGTGFCGGFTTYSSFAVGAFDRGRGSGTLYAAMTVAAAVPACALGFWLGASAS
jgi:CrcB protein